MKKLLCLLLVVIAHTLSAQNASPTLVLENMQKRYASLDDASAKFTQKVSFKYAKIEQVFSGTVKMKKGNRYRVESNQQTLVTDGKTVWLYTPASKQVLIDTYKNDPATFSPDRMLLGLPKNFQATLLNEDASAVGATYVLKLAPKTSTESTKLFKSMKVWITDKDWSMRKIEYTDLNETTTVYSLSAIQYDSGIADDAFRFVVPANTAVVDLRKAPPAGK
jgi:outer membrane lipoprotein carrier protein